MFTYPPHALVNRTIPKSRIFSAAKPSTRIRNLFTSQVSELVWKYKLSPDTVNLPAAPGLDEIQIFEITCKSTTGPENQDVLHEDVLRTIDKAIPSRICFEILSGPSLRYAAAFKRPSETDPAKPVLGDVFLTPWQPLQTRETAPPLPLTLNLAALYAELLQRHIAASPLQLTARPGETLETLLDRAAAVRAQLRECRRLEVALKREIQFNRKVQLNAQLRQANAILSSLRAPLE